MNPPIERLQPPDQAAPLSFAQQRLWLLDRLMPTGSAYNIEHLLRLAGELDAAALRGALNELVRRHEVLRTRFGMQNGQPVQVIAAELTIALALEDLQEYAPGEREREARRRAQVEAEAPFDLARGPLIRARLFRLAPSEHWLLLTLHHIVTDGWSSGVLTRELTALYGALHRGEASPLPPLPVQYADYAVWQRQWLQGEALGAQLEYWRRALAGLPLLALPTDRPRPATASYRGGCIEFEVPESLTRSLNGLSRREGATLFMTLLAAFQILLFRHSGQEDIAVGVLTAGRTRPQLEPLIGFFVNTLVLRGDLSGNPGFTQYLRQVRDRALDAYSRQDLPFEKLVEELAPKRDLSRNPLFQASLVLQNTPPGHWELPGIEVKRLEGIHAGGAKFDLALSLTERSGTLTGRLEYASDLFDAATIERMAGHFVRLLEGIVVEPQCGIAELPLLTADERHRLLVEWNATTADLPQDRCVHELFEEQAARRPDAVAVVFEDKQLTCGELDARANRLAHHLRTLGVGPEVLVGICVERSLELVVGLLGILKAGGAYVPLDPGYPKERLAFMLRDSGAPVLVTQQALLAQLPQHGTVVCLDRDWPAVAAQPPTAAPHTANATNLAYVIYTSGSTGTPKGVMIEQHSLVNYVLWLQRDFPLSAGDRMLQSTPASFDVSILELFLPLTMGVPLEIAPPGAHRSANELVAMVRRRQITVLQVVPSMLSAIAKGPGFGNLESLRRVFSVGEALEAELVDRFHEQTAAELVNGYGPTETTVYSTYWICDRAAKRQVIPIGRPLANTRIRILDSHGAPVPIGVAGELHIAGDGVGRGYRGRPDLTAERFVADPFAHNANERMYRTGDLASYLPDGNISFLGRRDDQVKLHGFRIEPGEIEAALKRQANVNEALVMLREDVPGDPRLVAYVVAQGTAISAADLRASLKQSLPHYMLPSAFVFIDALPLAPNGKVDRKSLPVPGAESLVAQDGFVAPHDAIEVQLVRTWEAVLGRYPVGVTDDFFDLGGHSLLAMQVIHRVNQLFGCNLPVDVLWRGGQTIKTLAAILRDCAGEGEPIWSRAVPIRPNGKRRPLFCAPVVGGHLFFYDNLARHLDPEQPVYALPAQGTDGRQPPHTTIEAMAVHAIQLMREVQPAGPYALLGFCSGGVVAFEIARQLEARGESASLLALVDSWAPGFGLGSWRNLLFPGGGSRDWRLLQERIYQMVLHPLGLSRLRRFAKLGEAHRWALWSYQPKRLAGAAVLMRPSGSRRARNPALGWDRFVAGGVAVKVLSGQHGDLVKGPGAARLAEELANWLP